MFPGRNQSIDFYMKMLDLVNIRSLAHERLKLHGDYQNVTKAWVEAVLIELNKKDLLMKFKGD